MAKSSKSNGAVLHPIGQLYGQWVFNFMVDIAGAIAFDFTDRPQHYRSVPDELGRLPTGFRSSMGSHPDWPDAQQRIANFRVLGTACLAGVPLREAALVYVQSGTEETRDLLAEAFRDTAESFRAQMRTVDGQSLRIACRQNETIFDAASPALPERADHGCLQPRAGPEGRMAGRWPAICTARAATSPPS
ncbi:MAG: hypothetical protein R3D25_04590 [Geminicoccaceae bacterium]